MSFSQNYRAPNLVIPYVVPANIPDSLMPFIKPIYVDLQNLVQTLILYGGIAPRAPGAVLSSASDPTAILANNTHRFYVQALENVAVGAAINLVGSAGTLFVQNANATNNTKPCDGFVSETAGISAGGVGEIILNDGVNSNLSGLTVGTRYYLGTANGTYTSVAPVAAGNLQQSLGIAINSTTLRFWTGAQIQH